MFVERRCISRRRVRFGVIAWPAAAQKPVWSRRALTLPAVREPASRTPTLQARQSSPASPRMRRRTSSEIHMPLSMRRVTSGAMPSTKPCDVASNTTRSVPQTGKPAARLRQPVERAAAVQVDQRRSAEDGVSHGPVPDRAVRLRAGTPGSDPG